MNANLTIGGLAKAAGVHVETLRYYQRRGLIDEPSKPLFGGWRRYPPTTLTRFRFIKRAQQLGFTLDEIAGMLRLQNGESCREIRLLAENKLAAIEERIAGLNNQRRMLESLIADCARNRSLSCPIILSLSATTTGQDRRQIEACCAQSDRVTPA